MKATNRATEGENRERKKRAISKWIKLERDGEMLENDEDGMAIRRRRKVETPLFVRDAKC